MFHGSPFFPCKLGRHSPSYSWSTLIVKLLFIVTYLKSSVKGQVMWFPSLQSLSTHRTHHLPQLYTRTRPIKLSSYSCRLGEILRFPHVLSAGQEFEFSLDLVPPQVPRAVRRKKATPGHATEDRRRLTEATMSPSTFSASYKIHQPHSALLLLRC